MLTFAVGHFKRRQAHKHEFALRRVDLDITRAESESAEHVAAIEAEGEVESKAWDGLMASYQEAMTVWSHATLTMSNRYVRMAGDALTEATERAAAMTAAAMSGHKATQ